jgi:hypothetical protein
MGAYVDSDGLIWLDADAAPFTDLTLECIARGEADKARAAAEAAERVKKRREAEGIK